MWLEFYLLSFIPLMAIIASTDAFMLVSLRIARLIGKPARVELVFLGLLVVAFAFLVWMFMPQLEQIQTGFVLYADASGAKLLLWREKIQRVDFLVDVVLIVLSVSLIAVLAARQKRKMLIWVALAFLGNVGSAIWIIRNGTKLANLS